MKDYKSGLTYMMVEQGNNIFKYLLNDLSPAFEENCNDILKIHSKDALVYFADAKEIETNKYPQTKII